MPYSALDVYQATQHAQENSEQTLGGLLQSAFNNTSQSIKQAADINHGVMQSAIGLAQVQLDTWYKDQELQRQSQQLQIQAGEMRLRDKQITLMDQYHQDSLTERTQVADEKLKLQTQKQENQTALGFINSNASILQKQAVDQKVQLDTDRSQLNKIIGMRDPTDPLSMFQMDDNQVQNYKTQVPILQDRIAKGEANISKIQGSLSILGQHSQLLQQGLITPESSFKSISSVLAPKDLHPDSYPIERGEPLTNQDATETGFEDSDSDIESFTPVTQLDPNDPNKQNVNPYLGKPQFVKMNTQQMLSVIDRAIGTTKGSAAEEERIYPTLRNWMNLRADDQAQKDFSTARTGYLKQLASNWFDEGVNPSTTNQKLERIDPNVVKNYYRMGGTPEEFNATKQKFTDIGEQVRDGSVANSTIVPTNLLNGIDVKNLNSNAVDRQKLRDNLISSAFAPPAQKNTSVTGALLPNGQLAFPIIKGNDILFPKTADEIQDSDKKVGEFGRIQGARTSALNSVMNRDGTINKDKAAAALNSLPNAYFGIDDDSSNSDAPSHNRTFVDSFIFNSGDEENLQAERVSKTKEKQRQIKNLIKSGDINTISNLLTKRNLESDPDALNNFSKNFTLGTSAELQDSEN